MSEEKAEIAVTGLAVMGRNLARNLARHGFRVAVHNRTEAKTTALVEEHGDEGTFVATSSLEDLVAKLEKPRRILVMVKAGEGTDAVIDELTPLLEEGDILADAGNAHWKDTQRRQAALAERGVRYAGVGVSGGEVGALEGPSIMPGADEETYAELGPYLEAIAAHVGDEACCSRVGPDGAGHFVKMVHNGIEYADMQLIAESYDLLRHVVGQDVAEVVSTFRGWNSTELESYLIEITATVLEKQDPSGDGPLVDVIRDAAEQKGTGRWTVQTALDLGVPVTGIAEATMARATSGDTERRRAVREALGGHESGEGAGQGASVELSVDDLQAALYAAKVVAYAQGLDMIAQGSEEQDWDIDRAAMARLWRDGCIIRARLLADISDAVESHPDAPSLLATDAFAPAVAERLPALRRVVAAAATAGVPAPVFSTSLAYLDALRAERLPAALVQGLRDYFGAHTYERTDREGSWHVNWSEGGDEVEG